MGIFDKFKIGFKKSASALSSGLKEIIVNYVGEIKNPENDEVTVEDVIEIFSKQFPEFLLAIAEENWVNGYSQALSDVKFLEQENEKTNQKIPNQKNLNKI